jgi:hypothetical protein
MMVRLHMGAKIYLKKVGHLNGNLQVAKTLGRERVV